MKQRNATAFVWAGDAIYADETIGFNYEDFPMIKPIVASATPEKLNADYAKQLSNQDYVDFTEGLDSVFGTLDDHDYGMNNGDITYAFKVESARAFLDFTNEPQDSPIRIRAEKGMGIYGVKLFDFDENNTSKSRLVSDEEAGVDPDVIIDNNNGRQQRVGYSNQTVAVFVLDVRSNRTPWNQGKEKYEPLYNGDILGEHQWQWFEKAIQNSRASVNVVVSGIQIHAERYPDGNVAEDWSKYPNERKRLYNTILKSDIKAPFLLSGDVHMAQLTRVDCHKKNEKPRTLMEITTSGLTHSWGTCFDSQPKYHLTWRKFYAYFASRTIMTLAHNIFHWPDLVISSKRSVGFESGGAEGSKTGKQYSLDLNFSELEVYWEKRALSIRVFGREGTTPPILSYVWTFDQLEGKSEFPDVRDRNDGWNDDDWNCEGYRETKLFHALQNKTMMTVQILAMAGLLFLPVAVICYIFATFMRFFTSLIFSRKIVVRKQKNC